MTSQKLKAWPVQDAKARFSELLDACTQEGPQVVTKRGADTAVLVPIEEWRRLNEAARPSLKSLLLTDHARGELPIPPRGSARRRSPTAL
jgi:prevent-host-death family protein